MPDSQAARGKVPPQAAASCSPSESEQKPLTRREREVPALISEGCSNKQGALRMNISPRTFESHRAEAMRKLGARNTADLVRKALLLHRLISVRLEQRIRLERLLGSRTVGTICATVDPPLSRDLPRSA